MSQEEKHLSVEQIECLIETRLGVSEIDAQSELLQEAHRHLVVCEACQGRVSMHKEFDRLLRLVGQTARSESTEDCPSDQSLNKVAAGLSTPEEAGKVLQHVVVCDRCGSVLRHAMEVFDIAVTGQEEAMLVVLQTAQPEWQRKFAATLAHRIVKKSQESEAEGTRVSWRSSRFRLAPRWVYAIVAIVVLGGAVFGWARWHASPGYANRLLAQAYSQQRTIELRFGGANHGPVRVERGGESSRMSHPTALLEAEALVGRKISEHPDDPLWLQSRGRIDLLEGNYDAAIETLQRAVEIKPRSADLLTDLATANFQLAELRKQPLYYSHAVELLGQALAIKPDDTVALFNRAISEERLYFYQQAADDWRRYLELDSSGDWAQEARQRLAGIQKILENHEHNSGEHFMDGPQLNSYLSSGNGNGVDAVDSRLDDYAKIAMRDLIPEAFLTSAGEKKPSRSTDTRSALFALAAIAKSRHGDLWFRDFLNGMNSPVFPEAAQSLSRALSAEDRGDYALALSGARESAMLFRRVGNSAGLLAANVEEVAALRLTDSEELCTQLAVPVAPKLRVHRYVRLEAELSLEYAICSELLGDEKTARRSALQAATVAQRVGYSTTYLRALTVLAGLDRSAGKVEESWQEAQNGLSLFWGGRYAAMRGYGLQAQMDLLAEDAHEWFLQVTILQEAVRLIDTDQDLLLRAVAHDRLARAAMEAGIPSIAGSSFQAAQKLFASCPQNEVTRARQADAEIWSVRADIRSGKHLNSEDRLERVRQALLKSSYGYALADFFQAKAEVSADSGNFPSAEVSLASALSLTEKRLRSVDSERDRILWDHENSSVYRLLIDLFLREGRGADALEVWEWYRGAPLRSVDNSGTPLRRHTVEADGESSLAELEGHPFNLKTRMVVRHLGSLKQETVVSFAVLPSGLAVWVFDDRGIYWQWISRTPEAIQLRARHFLKLCADPRSDVPILRAEARGLYDLLIAPISGRLTGDRTVVFEGDGTLGQIPMQVLVDPQGRYLNERFDVDWSPGFEYEVGLRPSLPFSVNSRALVVATAEALGGEGSTPRPLPDAVREGRSVFERFPAGRLLVGEQATLQQVEDDLPYATIFHFAGHASAGPELGGLLLRRNLALKEKDGVEVLGASELSAKELQNLGLAVLSACSTELGTNEGINDPASVARAFLRAGVPHVVATRWAVDSMSANEFMSYFYEMLIAGNSVPHSLRLAGNKLRTERDTSHPFYWAAFNCFGRG